MNNNHLDKHRKVVIVCSTVYTSIGLIRCLGEDGYRPEVYCYSKFKQDSKHLFASRYVSCGRHFKTIEEIVEFLLNDYPVLDERPILFTIPDPPAYYIDLQKDLLEHKFILMSAGYQGAIAYWMNKANITRLAKKHGLNTPWFIELGKSDSVPDGLHYPVFTKSLTSTIGGKEDESICYSKNQLVAKIESMVSDRFIVMQFIKKQKEFNYFGLSIKGHIYIDYFDERPRACDGGYGHYNIFRQCNKDLLHKKIISFMEETGYEGLFDVEFLLGEDGILYFMEVNFRVDGELYKLSPGVNLPAQWCQLQSKRETELPESLQLGKAQFTGMTESYDFRENVLNHKISFFQWFWQFIGCDRYLLLNIKDPMPSIIKLCIAINDKVHSLL